MSEIKLIYNSLKLSDQELDAVEQLAAANYSPEKIALYLDQEKEAVLKEWYNPESEFRIRYNRGQLVVEFNINNKQRELAESGNITAAQIFLKESEKVRIENFRNQCLFGE